MAETYIRGTLRNRVTIAASAVDDTNLPPNPLSHVNLTIRFATAAANETPTIGNILATLTNIEILHRGASIVAIDPVDLYAYNVAALRHTPMPFRATDVNNATGMMTLIIPLGRSLYNRGEAFPATRSGELILRLTRAASDTNLDTVTFTIETVELPGATPERFSRVTTLNLTPPATGDNDLALFPSTIYTGLLVFSTTVPTGTSFTTSADRFKLLLNNLESHISIANWESLWGEWINRAGAVAALLDHIHNANPSAAYVQNENTEISIIDAHPLRNHVWLDFDPNQDGEFAIDAREIAQVTLRINAGDTNAIRVMPQELVMVEA